MKRYYYTKANTEALFIQKQLVRERGRKVISASFLMVGISLFTYVGGYYYLWNVKETQIASRPGLNRVLANAPSSAFTNTLPADRKPSINDPSSANAASETEVVYPTFDLSIPRLKIDTATVTTDVLSNSEEIYKPVLLKSLAHYKGTAYPGETGNVIIYGHSILPAFYNPKNYLSIFTKLDTLSSDDEIYVTWGRSRFTYTVEGMEVVDPDDLRVLKYNDGKTLTLITCVPPGGFTTRRLLVFARLNEN